MRTHIQQYEATSTAYLHHLVDKPGAGFQEAGIQNGHFTPPIPTAPAFAALRASVFALLY
jgi:hypothetical protein